MATLPPPITATTRPRTGASAALDVAEQADGVDQLLAVHRRNVDMVGDLRAHGHENRVEAARLLRGDDIIDLLAAFQGDSRQGRDARDFLAQDVAGQAIGGDAIGHHAAGLFRRVADLNPASGAREMIGAGKAGGSAPTTSALLPLGGATAMRQPFSTARSPRKRSMA